MSKVVQDWIQRSEYDLETADAMLKSGRFLYVLFMCQQAIEKILKAIYAQQRKQIPPRTHNLPYLVDFLKLEVFEQDKVFIFELNQFYIGDRYPGKQSELSKITTEDKAKVYLKRTQEVFQCLKKMLQLNK